MWGFDTQCSRFPTRSYLMTSLHLLAQTSWQIIRRSPTNISKTLWFGEQKIFWIFCLWSHRPSEFFFARSFHPDVRVAESKLLRRLNPQREREGSSQSDHEAFFSVFSVSSRICFSIWKGAKWTKKVFWTGKQFIAQKVSPCPSWWSGFWKISQNHMSYLRYHALALPNDSACLSSNSPGLMAISAEGIKACATLAQSPSFGSPESPNFGAWWQKHTKTILSNLERPTC